MRQHPAYRVPRLTSTRLLFVTATVAALSCGGGASEPSSPTGGRGATAGDGNSAGAGGRKITPSDGGAGGSSSVGGGSGGSGAGGKAAAGGGSSGTVGGAGGGGSAGTAGSTPNAGGGSGFGGSAGASLPVTGGTCARPGGERRKLPGTGVEYCVRAAPSCKTAAGKCPLYVTLNSGEAYFDWVADEKTYGTFITVELYQSFDGNDVKDPQAELPRVIAVDYPGLDRERIYIIGFSAGTGGITRGECHYAKMTDKSKYGTTSDIYAALVGMGGCLSCPEDYKPLDGKWHIYMSNGATDSLGGADSCLSILQQRARINGCANPTATWQQAEVADLAGARPRDPANVRAEKVVFTGCTGGDVIGFRYADEGHVPTYMKYFDPRANAYDIAWKFLQGKTKH